MDALRLYAHSIRMLARGQLEYQSAFFMQAISFLGMSAGESAATLLLFSRFDTLVGWTRAEALFFVGLTLIAFNLVEMLACGMTNFSVHVRSGTFDRMLLRPRALILQVLCCDVGLRRVVAVLLGAGMLAVCSWILGIGWTAPKLLCLAMALIGGCALFLGLFIVEATLSLRTIQSTEFINIFTYGGKQASSYPVTIYHRAVRWFFYVIPYALCLHIPASWILGKPIVANAALVFLSPLSGVAFLMLMIGWWCVSVRGYQSTGS